MDFVPFRQVLVCVTELISDITRTAGWAWISLDRGNSTPCFCGWRRLPAPVRKHEWQLKISCSRYVSVTSLNLVILAQPKILPPAPALPANLPMTENAFVMISITSLIL